MPARTLHSLPRGRRMTACSLIRKVKNPSMELGFAVRAKPLARTGSDTPSREGMKNPGYRWLIAAQHAYQGGL